MICRDISGPSNAVKAARWGTEREPINIAPEVRDRLRSLLFQDGMKAVGYSEFIDRACERAEEELVCKRRGERTYE